MVQDSQNQEKNLQLLVEAFNENNKEKIDQIIKKTDFQSSVNFLEVANSEHKEYFITNHITKTILLGLSAEIKTEVLEIIGAEKYAELAAKLDVEDILSVIQDLAEEQQKEVISLLPNNEAKEVLKELLSYPEESAGRLIHKDFIVIPEHWTVNQSLDFLRMQKNIPNTHNQIFVVNNKSHPVGKIELSDILFSRKNTKIENKMNKDIYPVTTNLDQEEVADIFNQYGLLSTPVINDEGKIVGVISADDIVEVVTKEAEEDILHLGGVSSTDISTKFTKTISKRLPWLFITFLAINLTSLVVGLFEKTLKESVELAILMPIIAAMGGNAGVQASTIAVRAIATKKLTNVNTLRLIIKELFIGLTNGVILSACTILIIALRFHSVKIEMAFSISMIIVFSIATFTGSVIPILLNRIKIDPALSSSIITSAITDMIGFAILLGVASLLLPI
ncbi:MAG: magnesium transporter [Rickettsiaceae bacterium H1]|nr:magnesium transporter [Rickettsiaceae bacterium H1]